MGHDSTRAAIIYQHASAEADRLIAEAVGAEADVERKRARKARRKRPKRLFTVRGERVALR